MLEYITFFGMYLVYAGVCIMVTEFLGFVMLEYSDKLVGVIDKFIA